MLGGVSAAEESGGAGGDVGAPFSIYPGGGVAEEESIRMEETGGGNRWPRQETLALLKIRSDMDVVFRDSSLKAPLWDEVSRKMGELGFRRSAKKCKEKFENLYKYHKRTKNGRASKPECRSYRFFDQLEALETTPTAAVALAAAQPIPPNSNPTHVSNVSSIPSCKIPQNMTTTYPSIYQSQEPQIQHYDQPPSITIVSNSTSSSSSTSSDESVHRRKRKWEDFFGRLMADVVQKQQDLQKQFFDTLEKREIDRAAREDAWRNKEMDRINREHHLLVQERSAAAAKDEAVISFLQRITEQNLQIPLSYCIQVQQLLETTSPQPHPHPHPHLHPQQQPQPPPQHPVADPTPVQPSQPVQTEIYLPASTSRWPKAETETLIKLRTNLDLKYQENGPKGSLWEEVSAEMAKVGYNRSSKRCKEKWENINKYFKKVKESNKKRPELSKTCPYFHQLDDIYKERAKTESASFKPEKPVVPIMVTPEQQWPLHDSENFDEDDDEDEEDGDGGGSYEIVKNKNPSSTD